MLFNVNGEKINTFYRCVKLCSVIENAESSSAVSLGPLSQAPQCHWDRWVKLQSVMGTPESSSALSWRLLSQAPQCHWDRWVKLRSVIETAESSSAVSLRPLSQAPQCHMHRWIWVLFCIWHRRIKQAIVMYSILSAFVGIVSQNQPIKYMRKHCYIRTKTIILKKVGYRSLNLLLPMNHGSKGVFIMKITVLKISWKCPFK